MKSERIFPHVTVSKKGERWNASGHPWIYASDVLSMPENVENGDYVDAVTESGKYLGTGFFSRTSKICVRLLSRNANDIFDANFWKRRIGYALDYRRTVMGDDTSACRLIFGEADGFPGLTVDRFSNLLSVQIASAGTEKQRDIILPELVRQLRGSGERIDGVFLRNDASVRALEGLPEETGWYRLPGEELPDSPVTEICENGIYYSVDVENGQKTGFFLDQKYNRLAVAKLAKGKRVLDCFTHTGSFALNAAKGGAEHVTAVDVSASTLEMARRNAVRNGFEDRMDFIQEDVFELLPRLEGQVGHPYDFIILDPPAFTKSRKTSGNAEHGYREINYRALRLLPRGGYFATASCSHFMPSGQFVKMLQGAAADAGKELMQIEARQQAPDHPILWNVPETDYLKFYLFRVI